MNRYVAVIAVALPISAAWPAQAALQEPPEFPTAAPGPNLEYDGSSCFLLAEGSIVPGDRDWVQVYVPWAASLIVFDVDFPTNGAGSAMIVTRVGGGTTSNISDNNNVRDNFCGLGAASTPTGSLTDSAVQFTSTPRHAVYNVGVTGAGDSGFTGNHNHSFTYEIWVHADIIRCTSDAGCNDNIACTVDTCDVDTGICTNTPDNVACDNGQFCDGVEFCSPTLGCRFGPRPCNDGVDCTWDSCSESLDRCTFDPDDDQCDDGTFCNGREVCDPVDDCITVDEPDCDDGFDCTIDECDDNSESCRHTPDDGACDNGFWCDGAEVCDPARGCVLGTPPDCSDGVGCTADTCDEDSDSCRHAADHAVCSNGLACDGLERCDEVNDCQPGTAPDCDDGVACTVDACDESVGCTSTPDHAACDDGVFCNGAETCDALNGCQPGTPPDCNDGNDCTVDVCDTTQDACVNAADNAACDDGLFCNGVETCDALHGCQPGTPPDCDDAVDCTADACDEASDACVSTADDQACDDGLFCNGAETCDALNGCQPGTPPDCDDGIPCTVDACDESVGCTSDPDDSTCDDGVFCNGAERCNPDDGCLPGTDPCPGLFCRESDAACVECLDDADCDDGLFCNGAETCDAAGTCAPGTPPCSNDETCDEAAGSCELPVVGGFSLDLLPGQCPNGYKPKASGWVATALVAESGFDVSLIDVNSLELYRTDGVGGVVVPNLSAPGPRPAVGDVAAPFLGDPCGCARPGPDGVDDLQIRFSGASFVQVLQLDHLPVNATVELELSGTLLDGAPFAVSDCLTITKVNIVGAASAR